MNLLIEFVKMLGNVLYFIYETLIYGYVDIQMLLLNINDKECKSRTVDDVNGYFIDMGMDISWKTLEFIGAIKKYYNKSMIPYFHHITNDYFINSIMLIKNGDIVMFIKNEEIFNGMDIDNNTYDMVFYTDYSLNDSKRNYTAIVDDKTHVKKTTELLENKSDVSFIIFQLTVNDNKYDINLKEPHNFLVKNNTLKEPFFKWYMKNVYNVELNNDFSVNYMSQDMSIGNLHSPFFIKFNESSVTSFSSGKPKVISVIDDNSEDENVEDENVEDDSSKLITDILISERLKQHLD